MDQQEIRPGSQGQSYDGHGGIHGGGDAGHLAVVLELKAVHRAVVISEPFRVQQSVGLAYEIHEGNLAHPLSVIEVSRDGRGPSEFG